MLHNIFPQKESLPYFGFPGLGLNAGVALMNLTRFFFSQLHYYKHWKSRICIYLFSDYGIYLGAVLQKYPGIFGKSTGWPCTCTLYIGYILIWLSYWIISMTKMTESWLGDFKVILSDIFKEFSANLLLSLRELCHRLKLTLADQDVLNLVGGSIPDICHFFTRAKFLENKIYTEKTRKLRQNTK